MISNMHIKIEHLSNHIDSIPTLAKILHSGLGKWFVETSAKEIEPWFYEWLNDDLPSAYIALIDNIPVGLCSLQLNDGICPELSPWLGDLCVELSYQNLGIGRLLIDATKNKAKELGYEKLYLFSPDPMIHKYYAKLGWQIIGIDTYNDHPVTVMSILL